MRNLVYFLLLISSFVFAEDDPFLPFTYVVGEPMIKSVIGSDVNFPIQWTQPSSQMMSVIATGANVLPPLIDTFEALLKVAAQNSASGVTGSGTVITTGSFSNGLSAISLAQSGVALENILYLSSGISSEKSMALLSSRQVNNTTEVSFFDVLQKRIVSYSEQYKHRLVNISPTALSQDLDRRKNQMKARNNYDCLPYSEYLFVAGLTSFDLSLYCIPGKAFFTLYITNVSHQVLFSENFSSLQVPSAFESFNSNQLFSFNGEDRVRLYPYFRDKQGAFQQYDGYSFLDECQFYRGGNLLVNKDCRPLSPAIYCVNNGFCPFSYSVSVLDHYSEGGCPEGLIHYKSLYIPDNVLVCAVPSFDAHITDAVFKNVYKSTHVVPIFEAYPDFTFKINPYVPKKDLFYFSLSPDNSYLFYNEIDVQNQLVSAAIALKVFSDGFLVSKTLSGVKVNRQSSITTEVDLQIREIIKYDFNFNVIERNLSFWTGDGFDISIQNSFLSPKTYGIAGKTIAAQFGIRTLSSDMVLPQTNQSGSDSVVLCGLNKDVQVLKTRKNAEGKDENYFETQNSPKCTVSWGNAPTSEKVKGETDSETELQEEMSGFYSKLMSNFTGSVNFFPITSQCPPIEFDFTNAPMLKGRKFVFNQHCNEIAKNPVIESTIRFVAMIGWFFIALIRVLRA